LSGFKTLQSQNKEKIKLNWDGLNDYLKENEKDIRTLIEASSEEYRIQNSSAVAKRKKEYREKNKEKISEKQKQYYKENKEELKEYQKEYRKRNKTKTAEQKKQLLDNLKEIAIYNKNHFFSKTFFDNIHTELIKNLNSAIKAVKRTRGKHYLSMIPIIKKHRKQNLPFSQSRIEIAKVLKKLRKNPDINLGEIVSQFPKDFFNT
jgi:hypothetical protein